MTISNRLDETESTPNTLDEFLKCVELKAYRIALMAVGEHAEALDILQDSMFKLADRYSDKPPVEWKPLFYRILQNRIKDWHRHQKVKSLVYFWKNDPADDGIEEYADFRDRAEDRPEGALTKQQQQNSVLQALQGLPEKQQQCFLLRSWEGMSVAETAIAMGCSQGSVKTHYFRAVTKLRSLLGEMHDIQI